MSGRNCELRLELMDKPGQLGQVTQIIAAHGGNITSIRHERATEGADVNSCYLRVVLETRNYEHINEIKEALKEGGFKLLLS